MGEYKHHISEHYMDEQTTLEVIAYYELMVSNGMERMNFEHFAINYLFGDDGQVFDTESP